MAQPRSPTSTAHGRLRARKWNLLVLAGLPLMILHVGLLLERALHLETLDAVVVSRWILAAVLLAVLRRMAPQVQALNSPTLGVAAILIFAMIHLPVAAPEPSLPLAATSLGLALSLAVFDRLCSSLALRPRTIVAPGFASPFGWRFVSRDALKDRAPPSPR